MCNPINNTNDLITNELINAQVILPVRAMGNYLQVLLK